MSTNHDLSGVWRSTYRFSSDSRDSEIESEHYVNLLQKDALLIIESISGVNDSYVLARMTLDRLDNTIATGSWQEQTDKTGHYKGAVYHGALQVVIDYDKKAMKGQWVGFGRDMSVNSGPWEFEYVGEVMPPGVHAKKTTKV